MARFTICTIVLVALGAVGLVATAGARTESRPKLIGVVGKNNAYKITLTTASGKSAKTLKHGTYTFVIHDDSSIHNYSLDGPNGKSWDFTTIPFIGTKTRTLTLAAGKYKAYYEAHESEMYFHFTVE